MSFDVAILTCATHNSSMTITARVHNHSIALPADIEIAEGAEVRVTLPETSVSDEDERPLDWMKDFVGCLDSLPADAAERHTEYAHGRKRNFG